MRKFAVVRRYGRAAVVGGAAAASLVSVQANAAVTTIDTTEALGQVAEGATAAGAIGLAAIALAILIGVMVKVRRAGS